MSVNFFAELSTTYNIQLSPQQQEAVCHGDGPCLLLAVPGGGKTTTLLSRTAYLIRERRIPASRILSITFSRASANDMKSRFEELFYGTIRDKVTFSTIHSFSYGVVMNYMRSQNRQVTLIEGNKDSRYTKGRILRQLYTQINRDYISDGDYELLAGDIGYVKNVMMAQEDIRGFKSEIRNFQAVFRAYEHFKSERDLIDFDDMLTLCHQILLENEQVRHYYQNRYSHIQVDEAQDTSMLQHAIIALVAAVHRNIFYVADDDQSIYGFRGASPDYLLNLKAVYKDGKVLRMEQNYRSTGAIVEACNTFIKKNRQRYDKEIHTQNAVGLPILIHEVETRGDQYGQLLKGLEGVEDFGDVAVLYRNNHSAVSMVHTLVGTGIPFKLKGMKRRFFDHWVVRDILTILAFAEDPRDLHSFTAFYYKLRGYYVSKQMIEGVDSLYRDRSVFQQLIASNSLAPYQAGNLRNMEEDFGKLLHLPVRDRIEYLLTSMGYLEFLIDRCNGPTATFESYNRMLEVLKDLAVSAASLEELKAAIDRLEQQIHQASENKDPHALTLSTVHSAKGLEWSKVFMIDLVSGIFPNKDALDSGDPAALEEERRLFYVGMTRTRRDLTIYKVTGSGVSLFVEEVETIVNPKAKRAGMKRETRKKPVPPKETYRIHSGGRRTLYDPLEAGARVVHKVYGEGVVKSCTRERIVLVFHDGEKQLNYHFCMNQGLIRTV